MAESTWLCGGVRRVAATTRPLTSVTVANCGGSSAKTSGVARIALEIPKSRLFSASRSPRNAPPAARNSSTEAWR